MLALGVLGMGFFVKHSFERSVESAAREGWVIVASTPPTGAPAIDFATDIGRVDLQFGPLRWSARAGIFRPEWRGYRLQLDGPHELRWGTAGPVAIEGTAEFSAQPAIAIKGTGLRVLPGDVGASLRWSPAIFPGTIILDGAGPALDHLWRRSRLAPVQAAAALVTLLAGPGGQTAEIPLTLGKGWLEAAGFPVLPWPD